MTAVGQPRRDQVGSLLHGLAILDLFSPQRPVLGVGEIARALNLHKSSASRLAATLKSAGYLQPTDKQGTYRLAPKLLSLAALVPASTELPDLARPLMHEIVDSCGETGHAMALEQTEVITVVAVEGWRSVRLHTRVGKRSPAHATAGGKALLSGLTDDEVCDLYAGGGLQRLTAKTLVRVGSLLTELAQVRESGVAYDNEELEDDLNCMAVPVADLDGRVIGAVGLSGPAGRLNRGRMDELEQGLGEVSSRISDQLGRALGAKGEPPGVAAAK